jgi:hypothetical protein
MTQTDASPAQKRQWLRENGYDVKERGRLSAEHEQAYASQAPNPQGVVQGVPADQNLA